MTQGYRLFRHQQTDRIALVYYIVGARIVAGSGNQLAQVAALIAAANYVEANARRNAFTRKPHGVWPGKGVRELGEKLRSLADIRSQGGVVTH